jgi:hypothetical protein
LKDFLTVHHLSEDRLCQPAVASHGFDRGCTLLRRAFTELLRRATIKNRAGLSKLSNGMRLIMAASRFI